MSIVESLIDLHDLDDEDRAIIEGLDQGLVFQTHNEGIRVVRTILSKWPDEYTQDKRLLHLYKRTVRGLKTPSPRYFALRIKNLGWWTSVELFREEMPGYADKLEDMKAKLKKELSLPEFYERFKRVAGHVGLPAKEILRRINISVSVMRKTLPELNKVALNRITSSYKNEINRRIRSLTGNIRTLLTKGALGRKARIDSLRKELFYLTSLNPAKYRQKLIHDLARAFEAIRDLNRKALPDLTPYLRDDSLSKSIKEELKELLEAASMDSNWRLK